MHYKQYRLLANLSLILAIILFIGYMFTPNNYLPLLMASSAYLWLYIYCDYKAKKLMWRRRYDELQKLYKHYLNLQ
jgi:hypothetical protein